MYNNMTLYYIVQPDIKEMWQHVQLFVSCYLLCGTMLAVSCIRYHMALHFMCIYIYNIHTTIVCHILVYIYICIYIYIYIYISPPPPPLWVGCGVPLPPVVWLWGFGVLGFA